jgi:hypothetical protein
LSNRLLNSTAKSKNCFVQDDSAVDISEEIDRLAKKASS